FLPALSGGGAERITLTLAKEFVNRGFQVDLVLTALRGDYVNDVPEGVRIVNLRAKRIIAALPNLIRYFRQERPEVMLSATKAVNCLAVLAKFFSRTSIRL